ncbi:uncharacterized protein LOC141849627 [Brevipalpus obovatus]|uniref:uncharacterized protein LOC141849627 n=1 Tax=Brevipalpus obovatus TaxID=246614 RepID=UPI003D9F9936
MTEKFAAQIYATSFYFEYIMIIGGACSTIMIWRKTNNDMSFKKFITIIVNRFCQFQIVFFITFSMQIILPFFGDGPLYHMIETDIVKNCQYSFWYNIFHIANLLDLDKTGLTYLWTASTEFQLFIVVSFMIFIEKRFKYAGLSIGLVGTFSSLIYTVHTIYKYNIQPGVIFYPYKAERIHQFFGQLYSGTLCHAWSYLGISVILIWILQHKSCSVPKWLKTHFTHAMCALLASFSLAYFNCFQNQPNSLSGSIYFIWIAFLLAIGNFSTIMTESDEIKKCCSEVEAPLNLERDLNTEYSSSSKLNLKSSVCSDIFISRSSSQSNQLAYWLHVGLRLSRAAYFSHWTFLTWYFLGKRKPVSMVGFERIKDVLILIKIYIVGFTFYLLVIGPCGRITDDIRKIFIPAKFEKTARKTENLFQKD